MDDDYDQQKGYDGEFNGQFLLPASADSTKDDMRGYRDRSPRGENGDGRDRSASPGGRDRMDTRYAFDLTYLRPLANVEVALQCLPYHLPKTRKKLAILAQTFSSLASTRV